MKNQDVQQTKKLFIFNFKLLALVFLSVPLFLKLGFWQLDRAQTKRELKARIEQRQHETPQNICDLVKTIHQEIALQQTEQKILHSQQTPTDRQINAQQITPAQMASDKIATENNAVDVEKWQFKFVQFSGELTNKYFLIDNQTYNTQVGYEVLQILKACGSNIALSRGFVGANPERSILPKIELNLGTQQGIGYLYLPEKNRWLSNVQLENNTTWPQRIAQVDLSKMEERLGAPMFPFVVRLQHEQLLLFTAHWAVQSMSPVTHIGYAIQWFGMAIVVLILFFYSGISHRFSKQNDQES